MVASSKVPCWRHQYNYKTRAPQPQPFFFLAGPSFSMVSASRIPSAASVSGGSKLVSLIRT